MTDLVLVLPALIAGSLVLSLGWRLVRPLLVEVAGDWVLSSIDWSGPLTQRWPLTVAERVARATAANWAVVGEAFTTAGDDMRRAMMAVGLHANQRSLMEESETP